MTKLLNLLYMPIIGVLAAVTSLTLVALGNPANMGFCMACFLRDTAGAVGLHSVESVRYARPEVIGVILGAFLLSTLKKEFEPKGGSAPLTRFVLGFAMMIGALIFLGCPFRMVTRLAGGDLNAVVGLVGFAAGIFCGVFFLNKGYSLKRTVRLAKTDGMLVPLAALVMLAILVIFPSLLAFSKTGPGSEHAPVWMALMGGLIMGSVGFASRLCFVGGIRDSLLFRSFSMLSAVIAFFVVIFIGNIVFGNFNPGFEGQPIAHTDGLWNFLGMLLVGLCSVLLSGCPFRQVVLAGGGNSDSAMAVLGMTLGAAIAHNFDLASSAAGVTYSGKIGFAIVFAVVVFIAVCNTFGKKSE